MNNDNQNFASIDTNLLSDVTGGGLLGGIARLGREAAPFIRRAAPVVGKRLAQSAIWAGVPGVGGIGAAWLQHRYR